MQRPIYRVATPSQQRKQSNCGCSQRSPRGATCMLKKCLAERSGHTVEEGKYKIVRAGPNGWNACIVSQVFI